MPMHRYIPYLAKNAGFTKIGEKQVQHTKRKYGKSKFGIERFINGFLDLQSLWFLSTFGKKPMHFFGYSGLLMFFIGFVMTVWIIVTKLVHQAQGVRFRPVTDQPLFYLALLAVILGVMLFLAGFLGEMIARSSGERNQYNNKNQNLGCYHYTTRHPNRLFRLAGSTGLEPATPGSTVQCANQLRHNPVAPKSD